jgi:predicted SAM-dependent methyltransferase
MKLHLGCGKNYIKGWVNIDLDSKIADKRMDLTKRLPYYKNTVSHIYSEHFIEHISYDHFTKLLAECYRVLTPEGLIRISTPNLRYVVDCYIRNKTDEWKDQGWVSETSCKMMNDCFYRWGHKHIYDFEELIACLVKAGFVEIKYCEWKQSEHPEFFNIESRHFHQELIVEGVKR